MFLPITENICIIKNLFRLKQRIILRKTEYLLNCYEFIVVGGYNSPIILKNCTIRSFELNVLLKINSDNYPTKCFSLVPYLGIFALTSRQSRSIFWVCAPSIKNII